MEATTGDGVAQSRRGIEVEGRKPGNRQGGEVGGRPGQDSDAGPERAGDGRQDGGEGESLDTDKAEKEPRVLCWPVDRGKRTARHAENFRLGMARQ
jgi:hypothetical protein